MSTEFYSLFCMGNPLLDIQVSGGEDLLKKYNLKENDAILAGEQHAAMYVFLSKGPRWEIEAMIKNLAMMTW
jgi:adenosine kinase